LLHRLEVVLHRRVVRVGLSATLGDMSIAAEQLRPGSGGDVVVVNSPSGGQDVRLQIRGCLDTGPAADDDGAPSIGSAAGQVAEHVYRMMRGSTNLVFANSRNTVEDIAARLVDIAEREHSPNEFWPHHGSLAKELREDIEFLLRDPSRPATAVCTSTLEMGIDIGDIGQVAQVGPPPSVASLRQRLDPGVIFHSDRGCQYTSGQYARVAAEFGVRLSIGRKGQCWDNAVAESFFATIKSELLDRRPWPTKAKAHKAIFEYIEGWYNTRRLHSSLGYLSPNSYETTPEHALEQVA
jgi:hypothetical protein